MKSYDQIKNQLKSFEVDVDKEKLWANTAHAIPRRRRRTGLLLLLLAGVMLIGAGLFMLPSVQTNTALKPLAESIPASDAIGKQNEFEVNHNHSKKEEGITSLSQTQTLSVTEKKSKSTTSTDDLPTTQVKTPSVKKKDEPVKMNTSNQNLNEENITNPVITSAAVNASSSHNNQDVAQSKDTPSNIERQDEDPSLVAATKQAEELSLIIAAIPDEKGSVTTSSAEDIKAKTFEIADHQMVYVMGIDPVPFGQLNYVLTDRETLPLQKEAIVPMTHKYPFELYITQSFGLSSLAIQAGSDDLNQRVDFLNENIKSLESLSTRVGARKHLSNKWIVGGGMQWNQLTTQTNFSWVEEERITGEGVAEIVIDPDGTQNFQSGEVGVTRQTYWEAQRYTKHTTLNIEGQFAYQLFRKNHFDIMAGIRGTYNLFYKVNGSTFDVDDQPKAFTSVDQPYKLTSPFNIGLSLTGSYQFNRHWGLQIELQADRLNYHEDIDQTPVTYKHTIFALGIGMRYIF